MQTAGGIYQNQIVAVFYGVFFGLFGNFNRADLITKAENGILKAGSGWTDIFIYPGYPFKMIDRLITNFHLPESTLMMLVSALAGKDKIMAAYEEAVKERYRFFSFGDAMFIM